MTLTSAVIAATAAAQSLDVGERSGMFTTVPCLSRMIEPGHQSKIDERGSFQGI